MRTKIVHFFTILLAAMICFGCSDDKNDPVPEPTPEVPVTPDPTPDPTPSETSLSIDCKDIIWYHETTGELVLDSKYNEELNQYNQEVGIYLDEELLFTLTIVQDVMSQIINKPVLHYDKSTGKFHIEDGYPNWDSSIPQYEEVREFREAARKEIEKEWNQFINYLEKENKLRQDEGEDIIDDEEEDTSDPNPEGYPLTLNGEEILWFNEATGEIKLDSVVDYDYVMANQYVDIYLGEESLFKLEVAHSIMSKLINHPVLYWDVWTDKTYIHTGYPNWDASDPQYESVRKEREVAKKEIEKEWKRFIKILKKENKLQ